jgi:predicted dinucleotide-binding enzyme
MIFDELNGKVAIVGGGNRGEGIANLLSQRGLRIMITPRATS